jgi:hypothetical protein
MHCVYFVLVCFGRGCVNSHIAHLFGPKFCRMLMQWIAMVMLPPPPHHIPNFKLQGHTILLDLGSVHQGLTEEEINVFLLRDLDLYAADLTYLFIRPSTQQLRAGFTTIEPCHPSQVPGGHPRGHSRWCPRSMVVRLPTPCPKFWSLAASAHNLCHPHGQVKAGHPICKRLKPVLWEHVWCGYHIDHTCSLSLWRVVRGSKLMHLELIHGLFIN